MVLTGNKKNSTAKAGTYKKLTPQKNGSDPSESPTNSTEAIPSSNDKQIKEEPNTVDPGLLVKHPLQNSWTLWYLESDHTKSWEDMQNEIISFSTVEDFWSLYNHIKQPSELKSGSDYSLFKKGIRPMWEDIANKNGGRWVLRLGKVSNHELNHTWLDVLLCLIGETFEYSEEICGAVINIRTKSNKISIWTCNGNNKDVVLKIGHKLRQELNLGRNCLCYQLHKDTMVSQGSKATHVI